MDELNDFGFSTISEDGFKSEQIAPTTKIIEQEIEKAKSNQITGVENQLNKIWNLLDYHYQDIDKHKEAINKEFKNKMGDLENLIIPLLNNLAKSSNNEYIYWPNRRDILEKHIEKITALTRDINIFTDAD
jgi:isoleucyl-tRNA synthetase